MSGPVKPGLYLVSLPGKKPVWVHVVAADERAPVEPPASTPMELADTEARQALGECA